MKMIIAAGGRDIDKMNHEGLHQLAHHHAPSYFGVFVISCDAHMAESVYVVQRKSSI